MPNTYVLVVLHKLDESFGYYDVSDARLLAYIRTRPYPHEICLSPNRKKIYIAEMGVRGIESDGPGGHTVAVHEIARWRPSSIIDTSPYDRPHGIVAHANGRLFITSESTKYLLIYDLKSEKRLHAVFLDQKIAHMVNVTPDGKTAYTANIGSNSITAVDVAAGKVLYHIPTPERPEGMVFSADGKFIYVVCRESRTVAIIDAQQKEMIDKIETGDGPVRLVMTPDGKKLVIPLFHSDAVQIADVTTRKITHTIAVGKQPAGTAISPDGKLVFIACEKENLVYILSMDTQEIIREIKTKKGCDAMLCLHSNDFNRRTNESPGFRSLQ